MTLHATPHPNPHHGAPALLLLLTALATTLACQHLWNHDDAFPWRELQLLHDMAPTPLPPCDHLRHPPFFPDTLRHTNLNTQQAAAAALRILQHLFHTFSSNTTSQPWHTQPRHDLLNKLQLDIQHLHKCLPDHAALFKGPRNPMLTINKYFRDIHLFLRAHNHSACAWDHVRLEARASFQHLHNLTHTNTRHH